LKEGKEQQDEQEEETIENAEGAENNGRQRGISQTSRGSSTNSNRSCSYYMPEKVKIFQRQLKQCL
jgi:hypothetical protein